MCNTSSFTRHHSCVTIYTSPFTCHHSHVTIHMSPFTRHHFHIIIHNIFTNNYNNGKTPFKGVFYKSCTLRQNNIHIMSCAFKIWKHVSKTNIWIRFKHINFYHINTTIVNQVTLIDDWCFFQNCIVNVDDFVN